MYEPSKHVVELARISRDLQREIADAYGPDFLTVRQLCTDAEKEIVAIYRWANWMHKED